MDLEGGINITEGTIRPNDSNCRKLESPKQEMIPTANGASIGLKGGGLDWSINRDQAAAKCYV